MRRTLAILLLLLLTTGKGLAAIVVQYAYLDPYGQQVTAAPSARYLNPARTLTVAVVGAVERSVQLSLLNTLGTTVASAQSPELTAADRITVDARHYAGAFVDLEAPAADGLYVLRARVLSSDGAEVATEEWQLTLDRVPPTLVGGFGWDSWNPDRLHPMPPDTLVSGRSTRSHWVSEIIDDGAGVAPDSGRWQSLWLDGKRAGDVAYEHPAAFDPVMRRLAIPASPGYIKPGVFLPRENGRFLSRFVIADRAGNVAAFQLPIRWTGDCDPGHWEYLGVFDPDSQATDIVPGGPFQGFIRYSPGMQVRTNPARVLVRVPRNHWWAHQTFGVSIVHPEPDPGGYTAAADYEDADFVYEVITIPVGAPGQSLFPLARFATPTVNSCAGEADADLTAPDLALADSAPLTPRLRGIELELRDAGVVSLPFLGNRPDTLVRVSPQVEPRPYDQIFRASPYLAGSCVVPAGLTSCAVHGERLLGDRSDGVDVIHAHLHVISQHGIASNAVAPLVQVDTNAPTVVRVEMAPEHSYAQVQMLDPCSNCAFSHTGITRVWLQASNASADAGVPVTIEASAITAGFEGRWSARLPLATLPGGRYDLEVFAEDRFGNRSAPFRVRGHEHDSVPPLIELVRAHEAPLDGETVGSIDDIRIRVSDGSDASPTLTRVHLSGGPGAQDIHLGYHLQEGAYRLHAPRMPPSGKAGDYRLEVTARDASGNHTTAVATFAYMPEPFGLAPGHGGDIAIPPLASPIRLSNGNWPLTSVPVRQVDLGGRAIDGRGELTITLSSDARAALDVAGMRLAPGATVVYSDYDFTANQGRISLPVHFPDPASVTPGSVGEIRIRIERPGTPELVVGVVAWSPGEDIEILSARPAYARRVERAEFRVVARPSGRCAPAVLTVLDPAPPATDYSQHNHEQDHGASCAIRWLSPPGSLQPMREDPHRLAGRIDTVDDTVVLRYQPGLVVAESGKRVFLPTGGPLEQRVPVYEPVAPQLSVSLQHGTAEPLAGLPGGTYPIEPGTTQVREVLVRGEFPELEVTVTDLAEGAIPSGQVFPAEHGRMTLQSDPAAPGAEQRFRVLARYRYAPEIFTEADLTFVASPGHPVISLLRPEHPNNVSPTRIEGRFGFHAAGAYAYDSGKQGRWSIRVYSVDPLTQVRAQLGHHVSEIRPDGAWSLDLGVLPKGPHLIMAVASPEAEGPTVGSAEVSTQPALVTVADATPITFALHPDALTGPVNRSANIAVVLDDPRRIADLDHLQWERSFNDGVFQSVRPHGDHCELHCADAFPQAGDYVYRVTATTRSASASHTALTPRILIYERPLVRLSGPTATITGRPVTWEAHCDAPGRQVRYEWTLRSGHENAAQAAVVEGASHTFAAQASATWYVTLRTRYADAPDVPGAWVTHAGVLVVAAPVALTPRILGPADVEVGRNYAYRATAVPVVPASAALDLPVIGQWELPDGSTHIGDALSYAPTQGDTALKYTAWLKDYPAQTRAQVDLPLRLRSDALPHVRLHRRTLRHRGPAQHLYTLSQARANPFGERPILQWNLPMGASAEVRSSTGVVISANAIGDYPVSVRVSDTRGHQVLLEDRFSVDALPPLAARMELAVEDPRKRAPSPVTAFWIAENLAVGERISAIDVALDGRALTSELRPAYRLLEQHPGDHTVSLQMRTTYGRTASLNASFSLVASPVPVCEIVPAVNNAKSLRVSARCKSEGGRVAAHHWWVTYSDNGETRELETRAAAVSFSARDLARGIREIKLRAEDDKQQSSAPAIWSP